MARARGGGLPWKGAAQITPDFSAGNHPLPDGQYKGAVVVKDPDLVAGNVKSNVDIFGVLGTFSSNIQAGDDVSVPTPIQGTSTTQMDIAKLIGAGTYTDTGVATVNLAKDEDAVLVVFAFYAGGTNYAQYTAGKIFRDGVAIASMTPQVNRINVLYVLDKPGAGTHSYFGRIEDNGTVSIGCSGTLLVHEVVT